MNDETRERLDGQHAGQTSLPVMTHWVHAMRDHVRAAVSVNGRLLTTAYARVPRTPPTRDIMRMKIIESEKLLLM